MARRTASSSECDVACRSSSSNSVRRGSHLLRRVTRLITIVALFLLLSGSLISAQAADPGVAPAPANPQQPAGNNNNQAGNNQQQQQAGNNNQQQTGNNNQQQAGNNQQQAGNNNQQQAGNNNQQQPAGNNNAAATTAAPTSTIPDSAPIGGITITQPAETADASYFKIASGAKVTFGWNFTDVIQTPKTLMINAVCTANGNTYSLAGPSGIPGTTQNFTWDAWAYYLNAQQSTLPPLIQATYRLQIFDPEVTTNGPGKMAANSKVQFAMYIPQAYTPLASGWICASCSGGMSLKSAHPVMLAGIATLSVMLAGGYSVLMRAAGSA